MSGLITFLNPYFLLGLLALPVLWYLLRVTPPAPRRMVFPALRFLRGLVPDKTVPSKTPWWLLLLRCLILACVIIALARPVLNPQTQSTYDRDVRIVIDTGWAAAQTWDSQMLAAEVLLDGLEQAGRNVTLLPTTHETGVIEEQGPMTAAAARSILKAMKPNPWSDDYGQAQAAIRNPLTETYWFGHGIEGNGFDAFADSLKKSGTLTYFTPGDKNLPVLIRKKTEGGDIAVTLSRPDGVTGAQIFTLNVLGDTGNVLSYNTQESKETVSTLPLSLEDSARNNATRIQVSGRKGAGATILLDEKFRKRSVGIVTKDGSDNPKPLIDAAYYLDRALQPFTSLSQGSIEELVAENPSVIILPDIGALPPASLTALEEWVQEGGLLLRFGGPEMAAALENYLTPVPLMQGVRALSGDITWENPLTLAPFAETSPFYGIDIPKDIVVKQQILSRPVEEEGTTWVRLSDGTPFITGREEGSGFLVLVHTTATPDWSNFAISKLYLDILQKVIDISYSKQTAGTSQKMLQALHVMDGFGTLMEPRGINPIEASAFEGVMPSYQTPPGFYGNAGNQLALNLGDRITLPAKAALPGGTTVRTYTSETQHSLLPHFLSAGFILLLFDWLILMFLTGGLRFARTVAASLLLLCLPVSAQAQDTDVMYAGNIHMAYIKSGDAAVDRTAHNGLQALADILTQRTSVEPEGVVGLDPETDTLAFFPVIYWPIAEEPQILSDAAYKNIQSYLDQGGTILFDTRDQYYSVDGSTGNTTANAQNLQRITAPLRIPALTPAPGDHVLRRSFYLLKDFPGRYTGGSLWVEQQSAGGRDGVSSVLVGGHDWAAAWSASLQGGTLRPHLSGGAQQQEMAYRFGVNLMMYALTGNYKADQVHLPYILERLDQ